MKARWLGVLCLLGTACGPGGFDAAMSDHTDPLTAGGSDNLFVISVSQAPEPFALGDLLLTFAEGGGTATALNFALGVDVEGDGLLGAGDELVAIEPGADVLGTAAQGTTFEVELMEELGESRVAAIWTGSWTAQ